MEKLLFLGVPILKHIRVPYSIYQGGAVFSVRANNIWFILEIGRIPKDIVTHFVLTAKKKKSTWYLLHLKVCPNTKIVC